LILHIFSSASLNLHVSLSGFGAFLKSLFTFAQQLIKFSKQLVKTAKHIDNLQKQG